MLPEMSVYIISAGIISCPYGPNILSMLASSFIVIVRQGWLDIIWLSCLVTCRFISGILCILSIFTIFNIFYMYTNSINGLASPIPHAIGALLVSLNFSGQICHLLPRLCVPGKLGSFTNSTFCIFCICWLMMHRTRHFWTLCVWRNRTPPGATFVFTPLFGLSIQNIRVWCAFLHGHLYPRNCSNPIARTMCSSGRQASLTERFSWGSTISGSASCLFFSQSIQWLTREDARMWICFSAGGIQRSPETRLYSANSVYCAYTAYVCNFNGWMRASPPSYTSAINQHKSCMWFQCPPFWEGCLLFQSAIQGRQNKGRQRRLQVVVREQLGPKLGNKAMNEYSPGDL